MNPERDGLKEFRELWRKRHPKVALFAALLVGGSGAWCLREKAGRTSSLRGQLWEVEPVGGAVVVEPVAAELEGQPGRAAGVGQILRSEANDATPEDREGVWAFLRESFGAATESPDWFVVDEALTWLRGAVAAAPEIEAGLMSLGGDRSLSESLRCFALQHLGMWAEEHRLDAGVVAQLRAATGELQAGGVGGAALRVLNRMRASPADEAWLRARVVELVENVDCSPEQRVAALQIAVELDAVSVEPIARKLVEPSRQVSERVNAFLALGRLGNAETLRWISSQTRPVEALVLEARERAVRNLATR
jgi:hypothetical protein